MSLIEDSKILRIVLIILSQVAYIATLFINALAGSGKGKNHTVLLYIYSVFLYKIDCIYIRSAQTNYFSSVFKDHLRTKQEMCRADTTQKSPLLDGPSLYGVLYIHGYF